MHKMAQPTGNEHILLSLLFGVVIQKVMQKQSDTFKAVFNFQFRV